MLYGDVDGIGIDGSTTAIDLSHANDDFFEPAVKTSVVYSMVYLTLDNLKIVNGSFSM